MRRYSSLALVLLLACGDDDVTKDPSRDGATPGPSRDGGLDAAPQQRLDASPGPLDAAADAALDASPLGPIPVQLRFAAKLGDDDFACGRTSASTGLRPLDFRFFVEQVQLIARDGSQVPVALDVRTPHQTAEVALIDFTAGGGQCGEPGKPANDVITGTAPRGDYVGIAFSTAVPEALNHADPAQAPAPLKTPGAYWSWLTGYRFVIASVRTEFDAAVPSAPDAGVSDALPGFGVVHLGALGCAGGVGVGYRCSIPNRNRVTLTPFDPAQNVVVADLGALFDELDVAAGVECHGGEPACASARQALGLDPKTGAALPTQSVFRSQ
jgi:uncharacterized repeat protein (TIGR04052 family)